MHAVVATGRKVAVYDYHTQAYIKCSYLKIKLK